MENTLSRLTAATVASVEVVNGIVGIAHSQGDGLFQIERNGHAFSVSVASACSGVESLIGFLIIGVAALYLVTGSIVRRGLWLFCGLVAVWSQTSLPHPHDPARRAHLRPARGV